MKIRQLLSLLLLLLFLAGCARRDLTNTDDISNETKTAIPTEISESEDIVYSDDVVLVDQPGELMLLTLSEKGLVGGDGQGTYKSFEIPTLKDSEITMTLDQLGKSFNFVVGLEGFVPCKSNTFNILLDRFGAESETLTAIVPEVPSTSKTKAVVQLTCEKGFADKKKGDLFSFPMTLRDGQKIAAEQTFTATDKGMDIKLQVKLTHMP